MHPEISRLGAELVVWPGQQQYFLILSRRSFGFDDRRNLISQNPHAAAELQMEVAALGQRSETAAIGRPAKRKPKQSGTNYLVILALVSLVTALLIGWFYVVDVSSHALLGCSQHERDRRRYVDANILIDGSV